MKKVKKEVVNEIKIEEAKPTKKNKQLAKKAVASVIVKNLRKAYSSLEKKS
jgi:hypothetical protein